MISFSHFDFFGDRFALLELFRVKKNPPGWSEENSPTVRKRKKSNSGLLIQTDISGSGLELCERFVPSDDMFLTYPEYFFVLRIDTCFSSLSKLNVPSNVYKSLILNSSRSKNRERTFNLSMMISLLTFIVKALRAATKSLSSRISKRSKKYLFSSTDTWVKISLNLIHRINVCLLKLVRVIQNVSTSLFVEFLLDDRQTKVRKPLSFFPKTDLLLMVNPLICISFHLSRPREQSWAARLVIPILMSPYIRTKAETLNLTL